MSIVNALSFSSIASGVLPVIAALYNYKHLDKVLKIVAAFLLVSAISDVIQALIKVMGFHNNMPVIHLYIIMCILFFGAIYYHAFFKPVFKKMTVLLSAIALLVVIFNIIFNEGIWEYPSLSNTVLSVLLIFFSLVYFYQ